MYLDESTNMSKVKEPKAIVWVLVFAIIFMVGFGIWHAPLLEFASMSVPSNLEQLIPSFGNVTQ